MATIGVFAAIFDAHGRMGLIKQAYPPHHWTQPGGRVEAGESPDDAILREVREETSIEGAVDGILGFYYAMYKMDMVIMYSVRVLRSTEKVADEEIAQFRYFGIDELPHPLAFNTKTRILDAFAGRRPVWRVYPTAGTLMDTVPILPV